MHDALAVVGVQALARIGFQDRGACLLDLEEQGIVLARHQEQDATAGADAADADHLDRDVHELEPVQEQTPVFLHGFPVAGKGRSGRSARMLLVTLFAPVIDQWAGCP